MKGRRGFISPVDLLEVNQKQSGRDHDCISEETSRRETRIAACDEIAWGQRITYINKVAPIMPKPFLLFILLLVLPRCSAGTVIKCDSSVKDFLSKSPHRSIVMHPQGCYMSWDESPSPFEAERRALLFCSKANPDSDNSCAVVATDNSICPLSLKNWVKERRETDKVPEEILKERQCQFGSAFEVKSAPGTKPPSIGAGADALLTRALAALGLHDYEPKSRVQIVFGRSSASKSNWIIAQALDFVKQKSGKQTCAVRVSSGWDPTFKYFETVFRVQLIACFNASGNSG